MTTIKLILKNVRKNIRDYLIYFLTLTISVSLFYAFNSISSQPAFREMGMTKTLLYEQLGIMISVLSVLIAIVLAFLIIYANQYLLKRRKKELGIYTMLGMKKGRLSRIFAGEAFCIGVFSLVTGLLLGLAVSQGLALVSLKLFAIEISKFQIVFSLHALGKTILCFTVIFVIVMCFNVKSVSSVKLIDLLTAGRKNESLNSKGSLPYFAFVISVSFIVTACVLFSKNGILPVHGDISFQTAGVLLIAGVVLFFYSVSNVIIRLLQSDKRIYFKNLNTFLIRQIGSKIHTNHLVMAVICGLLTITICAISIGVSTAIAMNELSQAAAPYDLNVLSDVAVDEDTDIAEYLEAKDVNISSYAKNMEQISVYEADFTYGELWEGQDIELWKIDEKVPESNISVITISDFNRAMAIQGKAPAALSESEFLLNCNYKGTLPYMKKALQDSGKLVLNGILLKRASDEISEETYLMTSVGNNDRGTLIIPDNAVKGLKKEANVLLVNYKPTTDSDEVLQKMIPIGLDESHGYRYAERNMMYDMFYGINALVSFLCCYIGLIFLLICAALLALKQLTETTDNIYRYGLLQKIGANERQINRSICMQTAVFFAAPLIVAGGISSVLMNKAMEIVEDFMNIHISANVIFTVIFFLIIYGSYFLAAYLSCKQMVKENQNKRGIETCRKM